MKKLLSLAVLLVPSLAFAQNTGSLTTITNVNGVATKLTSLGNIALYLLTALAVIFIVWNVVRYLIMGSGEEGRGKAGLNILWGIIGLFVIVSIWGLVNILTGTFATTPTDQPIPNFGNSTQTGGVPANNPTSGGAPTVY
jgi:heme/copper-type cytochrome/quinol oxidase subunit 4